MTSDNVLRPRTIRLTSGRLLARNTLWCLVGNGAPLIAAVFAIPILVHDMGTDRFGVLALVWAVVGYASLFDLGLGRALTQLVAQKLGAEQHEDVPGIVWTSLILMTLLGVAGGILLAVLSPWLVDSGLRVPQQLRGETIFSFYLLAACTPVVVSTAGLRGFLEAHQRFDLVSALRIPLGIFAFAGPLLALPFSKTLPPVVAILSFGRVVACVAYLIFCLRISPTLRQGIAWHRAMIKPLMKYGGWMTVSNVIGPLMVTMDRFVIGAMVSVTAVAYYATPYEAVTKVWILPSAIAAVFFPAFSAIFAGDPRRTALLYERSVKCILLCLFPVVLAIVLFAPEILRIWLGADFAAHSSLVLRWLAVGVFISSLALVPSALMQGSGRPDITAKLHLIELPVYLATLFFFIRAWGINGAAVAWTGRVLIDAVALFLLPAVLDKAKTPLRLPTTLLLAAAPVALAGAAFLHATASRIAVLIVVTACFAAASWFYILTHDERALAQSFWSPSRVAHSFDGQ